MSPRNGRAGIPDPERFFDSLRPARQACIGQLRNLPPTGPHYAMMRVVIAALDVAAEFFTHRRDFFLSDRPDMIGRGDVSPSPLAGEGVRAADG